MKIKLFLVFVLALSTGFTFAGESKITGEEALASSANSQLPSAEGFNFSTPYSTLPRESGGGAAKHYAVSAGHFATRYVTMDSTSTHNCALSGVEGDYRGWMEQGKIYESNGRWILYARAGGTSLVARAVCFPK